MEEIRKYDKSKEHNILRSLTQFNTRRAKYIVIQIVRTYKYHKD